MRASRWGQMTAALGLCLLGLPFSRLGWPRLAPPSAPARLAAPPPPYTPSEKARRAGWQCWVRAEQIVNREREALEAWDPAVAADVDQELWRRELIGRDRGGDLCRARALARQAAALARSPEESFWATVLQAHLAHEGGDHAVELHEVRRLMVLAPRNPVSRLYLQRAAACNGTNEP